jgi:hypothetical protein
MPPRPIILSGVRVRTWMFRGDWQPPLRAALRAPPPEGGCTSLGGLVGPGGPATPPRLEAWAAAPAAGIVLPIRG